MPVSVPPFAAARSPIVVPRHAQRFLPLLPPLDVPSPLAAVAVLSVIRGFDGGIHGSGLLVYVGTAPVPLPLSLGLLLRPVNLCRAESPHQVGLAGTSVVNPQRFAFACVLSPQVSVVSLHVGQRDSLIDPFRHPAVHLVNH